jgi:hypothetical protein
MCLNAWPHQIGSFSTIFEAIGHPKTRVRIQLDFFDRMSCRTFFCCPLCRSGALMLENAFIPKETQIGSETMLLLSIRPLSQHLFPPFGRFLMQVHPLELDQKFLIKDSDFQKLRFEW